MLSKAPSPTVLILFAMIGTSVWDYIFIRTCIFLLHLISPLSVVWLALEAAFYLFIFLPRKAYLQTAAKHRTTACRSDRWKLFRRCQSNIPDPDRFLTKWFLDAPAAEIKRENVKDFYRWAFLNTREPDLTYDEELEEYLEPGRGNAKCLSLTLDKVEILHRSLTYTDGKDSPDGQVGNIALEIMPISSRITAEAILKDEMCEEVDCILKAHGWEKFVLVSHSYGSVVAAHLLHTPQITRKIGPMLSVDPVSFLLHLPDVAYNFTYRKPSRASEYLLSYFGSKDMGVSHTPFRHFFWADNVFYSQLKISRSSVMCPTTTSSRLT
ncbi:hypothetical protein B0J13DRAFT_595239 [Dactylonectria estremocensis]|uniref:AB hydrolase-1 domain-containing protein n=1 Tax=Dactylonectria estremocensis TaxID=1079267 RepID=A0A9P9EX13_9HYPO|nr:hypothetical protein B0J13DRAFT_595239 [Dactylonectria estremocensis]